MTQVDSVLDKALRVLGTPSFSSQAAICCVARRRTFAALQKDTIRRKVNVNSSGASPKPRLQSAAARVATAKGS